MSVYKETIALRSKGGQPTFINITPQVKDAIVASGIQNGIVTIISPIPHALYFLRNMFTMSPKTARNIFRLI